MIQKQQLRIKYKELRKQLSDEDIETYSLQIANQLLKLNVWDHKNYHLFLSIEKQKEVQTHFILNILQGKDKNVILSKSNFVNFSMSHFLLTDDTKIITNKWGIPEPDASGFKIDENQLDVVFIPLLVCDNLGNRIGYGKGFYDRFLKKCRPNTIKIGLSFFPPINEEITTLNEDIAINLLICPNNSYKFG